MPGKPVAKSAPGAVRYRLSEKKLRQMIEDATVDAYGEAEQLPLPVPRPAGWEWIEAYRRWARGWLT